MTLLWIPKIYAATMRRMLVWVPSQFYGPEICSEGCDSPLQGSYNPNDQRDYDEGSNQPVSKHGSLLPSSQIPRIQKYRAITLHQPVWHVCSIPHIIPTIRRANLTDVRRDGTLAIGPGETPESDNRRNTGSGYSRKWSNDDQPQPPVCSLKCSAGTAKGVSNGCVQRGSSLWMVSSPEAATLSRVVFLT